MAKMVYCIKEPYPPYFNGVLIGDVNSDDDINAKDIATLRRYLAGGWEVTIDEDAAGVIQGTIRIE